MMMVMMLSVVCVIGDDDGSHQWHFPLHEGHSVLRHANQQQRQQQQSLYPRLSFVLCKKTRRKWMDGWMNE